MFCAIERFAIWAVRYRSSFRTLVVLGVGAGLLLHFSPGWVAHAVDFPPKTIHIGLIVLLGILGIGGLALQVLHTAYWFNDTYHAFLRKSRPVHFG